MRKWLIWAVCVPLAAVSGLSALANSLQGSAPATAVQIPFHSGAAKSSVANAIIRRNVVNSAGLLPQVLSKEAVNQARGAFLSEPTETLAVAVLGLDAAAQGDRLRARRIFEANAKLGRRQIISQAWLADEAARRNDLTEALRNYDLILRRQNSASASVLAQLVLLLRQDAAVPVFVRLLETPSPWHPQFWEAGSNSALTIENTARVRSELAKRGYTQDSGYDALLLSRLTMASKYDQADKLYRTLRPDLAVNDARQVRTRAFGFGRTTEIEPYFWVLQDERGDLGGYINAESKTLDISVLAATSGQVARRLTTVPGQTYRIRLVPGDIPATARKISVRVKLTCATDPRISQSAVFDLTTTTLTSAPVTISEAQCKHFWLELEVVNDGRDGLDFTLKQIELIPS